MVYPAFRLSRTSRPDRRRLAALFACLVCTLLTVPVCADPAWINAFTERVLRQGREAQLPPHLALVLGLGTGETAVAVKQLGIQSAQEVRTFNVCQEKGKPVVVIVHYNQKNQIAYAYLLGSGTKLRKAVTYEAGAQPALLSGEKAKAAFREELQYWSNHAALP
jgi:hypothetical protein